MKKQISIVFIIVSIIALLLHISCTKESIEPGQSELPIKQLDSITDNVGKLLYKFFYKNDTIVEFKYYGHYYSYQRAVFKHGKLFRMYYPENHYVQYSFPYHPNDSVMYVTIDQDTTNLIAVYYFDDQRVTDATFYPYNAERYKYKYIYDTKDNLIRIEYRAAGSSTVSKYEFVYDDAPNPWFGMGLVDDFISFSKNNYTELNGYPYSRYKYDDDGYMIECHNIYSGITKFYYHD